MGVKNGECHRQWCLCLLVSAVSNNEKENVRCNCEGMSGRKCCEEGRGI